MCRMTDVFYVYCEEHYHRIIDSPCERARAHSGLQTTGCWNAVTVNHTRVLDFCPSCKRAGRDTEEYRQDQKKPFYQFDKTAAGPKTMIPLVTFRPLEERRKGPDSKIWLQSFGGSSANASAASSAANSAENSRRKSVDPEARRGSYASFESTTSTQSAQSNSSTKPIPEIMSKSRYSQGSSAAWGMTPEELHRRSTTYLKENGSRSGSSTTTPPPTRPSRPSTLDTIKEQGEQFLRVPETPRGRPILKDVDFATTRESHCSDKEVSPKTRRLSPNFTSVDIGLGKRIFGKHRGVAAAASEKIKQKLIARQCALRLEHEEEEERLASQPEPASLVLARKEVARAYEDLNMPPDVLEHMARHAEKLVLEDEESAASSRSSSTSTTIERLLNIPPDVSWHMKNPGRKLRRESDEKFGLEFGEVRNKESLKMDDIMAAVQEAERDMRRHRVKPSSSLRGGKLSQEDSKEMSARMAEMVQKGVRKEVRKDSGICMEYDELE